jgi:hypothetical protein
MMILDTQCYDSLLDRALLLATEGHSGQDDEQGQPHILHALRVMMQGETLEEKIVGVLHGTLETTTISYRTLLEHKFPGEIVAAVKALTHNERQSLIDYYDQIRANPLALKVKRYDILDHYARLGALENEATRQRLKAKYERAHQYLYGVAIGAKVLIAESSD